MRVLMISKACIVGIYQKKLELIAKMGVELLALVPPSWKDERGEQRLERVYTDGYRLSYPDLAERRFSRAQLPDARGAYADVQAGHRAYRRRAAQPVGVAGVVPCAARGREVVVLSLAEYRAGLPRRRSVGANAGRSIMSTTH